MNLEKALIPLGPKLYNKAEKKEAKPYHQRSSVSVDFATELCKVI
jgi:hypothetical protein